MSWRDRTEAWWSLFRRYWNVFSYFWKHRHALKTDFFNKQEAEFLPASLSLQETPDSGTLRWTGRVLMAAVVLTLVWSIVGEVDIVVNASGKIIPSSRVKTIASVDVASVKALYVTEGQFVQAGDVLIELDSSASDAERDKAADVSAQARLQVARSKALIQSIQTMSEPKLEKVAGTSQGQWQAASLQLEGQYKDFVAKLNRLDGEIERYSSALPLVEQRATDYKSLMEDNTISRHAWLEKEQAKLDLQGQLLDAKNQRSALIAQTRKEAYDTLNDGQKTLEVAQQDQRRAGTRSTLLTLRAPVDGTVQQLVVHTVGGVVPAAQPLMQIVPKQNQVEVEAFLENKDIGFVQLGQHAAVKIDAFDYTKYGTVPATVSHVSKDAIQDEKKGLIYAAKVTLSETHLMVDGENVPLSAGMSVNVEIKTGVRRVIDYVLSPLKQHQREAFHER